MNRPGHKSTETDSPTHFEHSLAVVPTNLPMVAFTSSELATRGLSELAEYQPVVQELPPLPIATRDHVLISDEANERVLTLGCRGDDGLWLFSFRDRRWRRIATAGWPSELTHFSVDLDARRGRLICFGGRQGRCVPAIGDLMILELDQEPPLRWQTVRANESWPAARYGATLTIDGEADQAFLFGGDAGGWRSERALQADLWALDLDALAWRLIWQREETWLRRRYHRAEMDPIRGHLVLYGGQSEETGRTAKEGSVVAVVQARPDRHHWVAPKDRLRPGSVSAYVPELHSIVGVGGAQGSGAASAPPHLWRYDLHTLQTSKTLILQGIRQGPQDRFATCYCRHRRALFCVGGKPLGSRQRRSARQQGNTKAYLIYLDRLGGQSEAMLESVAEAREAQSTGSGGSHRPS